MIMDDIQKEIASLTARIDGGESSAAVYFERGKLRWRAGDRAGAQSDYTKAVAINPESPAALALQMAKDVEAFYNRDLYNP